MLEASPEPDEAADNAAEGNSKAEIAIDSTLTAIVTDRTAPTTLESAFAQNDYEKAVELASQIIEEQASASTSNDIDSIQKLFSALQSRFRAYQALRLFCLAVSDANRIVSLLSEFELAIENDEESTPDGHNENVVPGHRHRRIMKRLLSSELPSEPSKRQRVDSGRTSAPVTIRNLPTEVILQIADYLDPPERIRLANSDRGWRTISELWQHLVFVRIKNMERGWPRDTIEACVAAIETCYRRSQGTLTSVTLKGNVLARNVGPILTALRPSSLTLTHLAIPTRGQERCYNDLYKLCTNLKSIDLRCEHQPTEDKAIRHLCSDTYIFTTSPWPFKLRYFSADPDIDCGFYNPYPYRYDDPDPFVPHVKGLEVVHGVSLSRQRLWSCFAEAIDLMAPTLREWVDRPGVTWSEDYWDQDERPQQLDKTVVFPCLRKLNGAWSEIWAGCEFPALRELSYNANRARYASSPPNHEQAINVISKSPVLKKLDILLPQKTEEASQGVMRAIAELDHLEELNLWFGYCTYHHLRPLVEVQNEGDDTFAPVRVLWPALHTLGVFSKHSSLVTEPDLTRHVCKFLAIRFFLLRGCSRGEAVKRTEAAMSLYEEGYMKPTKTRLKQLAAESVSAASESVYEGIFETDGGIRREKFSSILPTLVFNRRRNQGKRPPTVPNPLLDQLIDSYAEIDIDGQFVTAAKRT